MKTLRIFISSILAGMSIGLGGIGFLSLDNKVLGALLFSIGLFTVCTFGFHLFTGRICYIFFNDRSYALTIPVTWLGNFAGTGLVAAAVRCTRISDIADKAAALWDIKLNDSLISLYILAILANIFIYIAVEGYSKNPHPIGKYLSIILGVMAFILCGTEHCVADMFYFWVSGSWSLQAVGCILIITLGNATGGILIPLLRKAASGAGQAE